MHISIKRFNVLLLIVPWLLTGTDRKASFLFLNAGAASSTNDMSFSSREAASNKPTLELQY